MRAAIFRKGEIVADTLPEPRPAAGQVLVKTLACGICGSDLHTLKYAEQLVEASRRTGGVYNWDVKRDVVPRVRSNTQMSPPWPSSRYTAIRLPSGDRSSPR